MSYGSWIKIHNLPPNLWSNVILQYIGGICGGYESIARQTLRKIILMEASIKVMANSTGFIPTFTQIPISLTKQEPVTVQIQNPHP